MIGTGSIVRVLAPFDEFYPGAWEVLGQSETGAWQIGEHVDFAEEHLEEVV
jgi:hypothetical protein